MMINLSQALKEKNRLAGEISRLWDLVQSENACWEYHKRSIDINETMELIELYTAKLIELKTKIGKANEGNLESMYALEECKSQIRRLDNIDAAEDVRYLGANDERIVRKNCVISASDVLARKRILQLRCNKLQDELDAYNATVKIEFDTPLK